MNQSEITVGTEYAVGNPSWGLNRARVLEVGAFKKNVTSGSRDYLGTANDAR